jgi:hypothetical protein
MKTAFSLFGFIDSCDLSGSLPTEIGSLTELSFLNLSKYNGYLRSFHTLRLFFVYKLTYSVLFSPSIVLNSPKTPLSFIAMLSIICDSYYDSDEPAFWDHSSGDRTIDRNYNSVAT